MWCGERDNGVPEITASTRASSTGSSQSASRATIMATRTELSETSLDLFENTATTTRTSASPHSTRLNVQKVTFPTSSATGNESETAWNFTGVARKETPASMPAQKAATRAIAAVGNARSLIPLIRRLPALAVRAGKTWRASGSARSFRHDRQTPRRPQAGSDLRRSYGNGRARDRNRPRGPASA